MNGIRRTVSVSYTHLLTGGTHVDVEHRYVDVRVFITDQHGVLCRVHAANLGAVALTALIGATAAYTLDEHHILRVLAVGKALQMTLRGACRVHDALELEGRDDILALAVCVLIVLIELDGIEAGSDDDSACLLYTSMGDFAADRRYYDNPPAGIDSINWRAFFAVLYQHDYDGYLAIEPHSMTWQGEKGEKGVKYTIKYIRDLML